MIYKIVSIILVIFLFSCTSAKEKTKITEIPKSSFFKSDGIYMEDFEDNSINLYYFSSIDSILYFSNIKKETIDSEGGLKLTTTPLGRYITSGNNIKIQQDIDKSIGVKSNYIFSPMFLFLPTRFKTGGNVTIVDKEIITEGEIKTDTIHLTKEYFGSKELDFKRKKGAKINTKNTVLVLNNKLKGTITKDGRYSSNKASIISN